MEQGSLDKGSTKRYDFSRLRKMPCKSGGVNTLLRCHIEPLNRTFRNWRISLHPNSPRIAISISSGRSLSLSTIRICIPNIRTSNELNAKSKELEPHPVAN